MPHYDNLVLCRDELPQCLRFYTGFHAGILGGLFLLSTEIGNAVAVFDHRLVAAAGECQINGHACELIAQCIGGRIQTQTDTERGGAGISDINLLYFLKNGELVLCDRPVAGLFDNDKIFVLLHLLDDAVHIINILIDLTVNKRHEKRLADFLHTFHHFIVIVNIDQTRDHPLVLIFTDILIQFRHILE